MQSLAYAPSRDQNPQCTDETCADQNAKTIFPEVVAHEAIRFQAIRLTQPISTKMVMQRYGLTPDILIQYNPDIARSMIRFNGILPRNYEIKVPSSEVYMVDVKSQLGKS